VRGNEAGGFVPGSGPASANSQGKRESSVNLLPVAAGEMPDEAGRGHGYVFKKARNADGLVRPASRPEWGQPEKKVILSGA